MSHRQNSPPDGDTAARLQRVQSHTHIHTPSHMHSSHSASLSPALTNTMIGISNVPPSPCPSLFQ